ncbi:MAG TPA: CmcI family methyltransferase, partial [Chroococcidiopsis sp.]
MTHHILLYTDDPGIGGVAQYNHTILLGLAEQGYRVTCVQTLSDNPLVAEQKQRGIQHEWLYFHTGKEFGRTFSNPADAQEILGKTKPDLIIFSDACPISNFAAKEVAQSLGIPFMVVIGFVAPYLAQHFGEGVNAATYIAMLQRQYEYARAVIAVSQENLGLLHQLFGLPPHKGQVIHYGRPEAYFTPRDTEIRDRLRQEVGIPADAVVCFTAARLEAVKGFQYQLDAIVQLKDSPFWEGLYFVWAGDGALYDWLSEAIAAENMGDRVKLLGQRWDIAEWHNAADIFVLPSELEGMPLAIMEAMAKGNPVIATAVSGIPEELGDTGKLLPNPADDPQGVIDGLIETITEWADDSALRQAIGQACQQRATVMFKVQRMVNETLALVQSALEPVPQTTPPSSSSSTSQPPVVASASAAPVSASAPVSAASVSAASAAPASASAPVSAASAAPASASVSATSAAIAFPQGDYVSPGLALVKPDSAFPHKIVGDTSTCDWPYLRREIPHNWYVDERWPMVGFLSRDEAHILYNSALQFSGQRALEIGCWMGWSACHLALAGVQLDVVDPLLERPEFYQSVSGSLRAAGVLGNVNLAPGYSPQKVDEIAARDQRKWSLLFIDGNHEAPAPLQDAIACEPYAEADAMILFHDLSSPDVAQGLDYLRQRGWNTLIYQTMQIMGVAWRGNVQPVYHEPDPTVAWQLPSHLAYYSVSGIHYRPTLGTAARPLPPVASPVISPVTSPVELPAEPSVMPPAEASPKATIEQVEALLQQAIVLFNDRKLLEALHAAEAAVALGIAVPNLHYVRAMALCHLGRHKEGLAAAKTELAINPGHAQAQEMIVDLQQVLMQSNVSELPTLERPWHTSLPPEMLKSLQRGTFRYTYKDVALLKNPFDLALYPMLLWDVKPRTIIEIGSKDGGSAIWMGDMLNTFGLDGHIYSVDIVKVNGPQHPRVTYLEGNGRDLGQTFSPEFLRQLPRPLLVIDDADHEYETSKHILEFFHPHLRQDEYIVIEDGILADLQGDAKGNSAPHRALKEFLAAHRDEYVIDANYCDFFGYNVTWNTNGYLKRVKVLATPAPVAQPPGAASAAPPDTLIGQLLSGVEQIGGPGGSLGSRPLDRELLPQALRTGQEQMAQGAIQSAIATYQTILAMNPGSVTAHHALSSAYWQQNAVQKSLEHHLWANHAHTWLGNG